MTKTKDETEAPTEHPPSCGAHCASACTVSPRRATPDRDRARPPRVRVLHSAPVPQEKLYPRPLWEYLDDPAAVAWHRSQGCEVRYRAAEPRTLVGLPLPALDGPPGHPVYNLARWTADDGPEAMRLEQERRGTERGRRARILETNEDRRVVRIAAILRAAFPGITAEPMRASVVKRAARPASSRARELYSLVIGEALGVAGDSDAPPVSTHGACEHVRVVFTGLVWGLALAWFGRERDPLSDFAFGRLFKGAPISDQRAPFANAAHVLSVASAPLPGLGGGSSPWPQDDPRMAQRTWSKGDEMAVKASFHGSDNVRGERAVHRVLDARAAVTRAGLSLHERAMVEVLADRKLTRDEKALRLREIEAERRQPRPDVMLPDEAGRLMPTPAAWLAALTPEQIREATADVTDGALFQSAKAAQERLNTAVDRVSRAGDALAPKRAEKPQRPRPAPRPLPTRVRPDLAAGYL